MSDNGELILTKAGGKTRMPVPLADGAQQYVTAKATIDVKTDIATGKVVIEITSSLMSHDEDEMEAVYEATDGLVRKVLPQFRDGLTTATEEAQKEGSYLFRSSAVRGEAKAVGKPNTKAKSSSSRGVKAPAGETVPVTFD